ncbi:MAG: DUF3175 domain-containing protein [Candidatus Binataceae bacterium]
MKSKAHGKKKNWSASVKTVSTFPPPGTFTKSGDQVARIMSRPEVSPRGIGSAIRMIQMFINRAGKTLSLSRKRELEKAKHILRGKRKPPK